MVLPPAAQDLGRLGSSPLTGLGVTSLALGSDCPTSSKAGAGLNPRPVVAEVQSSKLSSGAGHWPSGFYRGRATHGPGPSLAQGPSGAHAKCQGGCPSPPQQPPGLRAGMPGTLPNCDDQGDRSPAGHPQTTPAVPGWGHQSPEQGSCPGSSSLADTGQVTTLPGFGDSEPAAMAGVASLAKQSPDCWEGDQPAAAGRVYQAGHSPGSIASRGWMEWGGRRVSVPYPTIQAETGRSGRSMATIGPWVSS